jgi:hypothetical protein
MKHRLLALGSLVLVPVLASALLVLQRESLPTSVAAQGTGAISGQVVWCTPLLIRAGAAGAEPAPNPDIVTPQAPEVQPDGTTRPGPIPMPIPRPIPPRPIPAGAVLVAVQNTSLSGRTDEAGSFRIEGVPVGQYFTIAAGPVRNAPAAIGMRPNVFVGSAGETVNIGQIGLGGPCVFGPVPLGAPGAADAQPGEAP